MRIILISTLLLIALLDPGSVALGQMSQPPGGGPLVNIRRRRPRPVPEVRGPGREWSAARADGRMSLWVVRPVGFALYL
jgi:hypothetical protein